MRPTVKKTMQMKITRVQWELCIRVGTSAADLIGHIGELPHNAKIVDENEDEQGNTIFVFQVECGEAQP